MANTIRASKNTFQGGLVMDLSPDTTPNEVLTSALNATLVTFNGNELQLQNDMGNGRVETARLPEGYIPVGTCEFGDIIYIVSYNPLTNKSQIGCFPSPERNISSEEIGSTNQTLSWRDFQEGSSAPNGELKASSVKKIIYRNKLNPGDKFIIYDKGGQILNEKYITDIGNTSHVYGKYPKWLRIHVIAIEDGGKINYLDSTLRWYESYNGTQRNDYFIIPTKENQQGSKIPDIDTYRNLLSSGYSVYQSKISGKLALLIELEKITGFSCTYAIYGSKSPKVNGIQYRDYDVYWNVSWDADDPNINPSHICLTKSEWEGKDSAKKGKWYYWTNVDDAVDEFGETVKGAELTQYLDGQEGNGISIPSSYEATITDTYITSGNIFDRSDNDLYGHYLDNYEYNHLLETFLGGQSNKEALTKLNVAVEDTGSNPTYKPIEGSYYINATYYDNKEHQAYTQESQNGKLKPINAVSINDIIVNNYFHYPVYKHFYSFRIPVSQTYSKDNIDYELKPDTTNLIYHYEITPAMPYGYLREFSIDGYIDFSKVGTGAIDITSWRYFNGENISNLTIGMDAYLEENMGIEEVVLEFYDNQGMAAAYHISDKESYSGQFTEIIPLNGSMNTYKMQKINAEGKRIHHCGALSEDENDEGVVYFGEDDGETVPMLLEGNRQTGISYYLDDCGTIYSNMLYLVKIVVKYCPKNALGQLDTSTSSNYKYFYRWMWTNTMFNKYYHQVTDYQVIPLDLTLDVGVTYEATDDYFYKVFPYKAPESESLKQGSDIYKYLSAGVQVVTSSDQVNELDENGNPYTPDEEQHGGPEEPLEESEIVVSLEVNMGQFRRIIVNINRTIHNVNEAEFNVTYNGAPLSNYTFDWEDGGTIITIDIGDDMSTSAMVRVQATYGAITYGQNQLSPAFDTQAES